MPENETTNSSAPPPDWRIGRHAGTSRGDARMPLWQRYRHTSRPFQVGIGCGGLLTICVLLSCVAAAFGAGGTSTASLTTPTAARSARAPVSATSTPARSASHAARATATRRPATTATPARSSTATAHSVARTAPTPTARPVVAPPAPRHAPTSTPRPRPAPTATPRPHPTPTPQPLPTPCPGVNCNPWGYNFTPGALIYSPPAAFCQHFACIPSFWKSTNGYVIQCRDGLFSHSGGRQGSCSFHHGDWRPLYSH